MRGHAFIGERNLIFSPRHMLFTMNTIPGGSAIPVEIEPFFELSPDLLCIAGYDGYFKRINPAVSRLLGYSDEELYSRPINDFIYPEDQLMTSKVRHELTRSRPLYNYENRYVTSGGEIVWLSWSSLPVEGAQLIYAIAKDITHKKKLEAERNLHVSTLSKLNQDLKKLNYTASHDLRAPVNNLLSVFGLLDVSKIADPETLEFIQILKSSAENLKQTLDGYVDGLSQRETLEVELEEVSFNEALTVVMQSVKSLIRTSGVIISTHFSALETILFHKAYLESIFLNLITNSIKYARADRPAEISMYSDRVNGVSRLVISDNGLGFDMEKVKGRIFGFQERFHNHVDSKGIGLYLVYNHVTSLGGHIDVQSKVNEGTTFTISFKD